MKGLAQRAAGFLVAELRPEHRQQFVTPPAGASGHNREVRQKADALRLAGRRRPIVVAAAHESYSTERQELDHWRIATLSMSRRSVPAGFDRRNDAREPRYYRITPRRRTAVTRRA